MTTLSTDSLISDVGRRYLQLQMTPDVGPIRLANLLQHFGDVDAVLDASRGGLERVDGVGPKVSAAIRRARGESERVDQEIARAAECGARILCREDEAYPRLLLHIPDPPICLFVKGALEPADGVAVAIVGTRRCSHYGREQAVRFGELLARAGFTIVSGLARGIDGHAHRGALRAGGRTIAVLGNGLSTIYPREHTELAGEVAGSGAIVTELGVDVGPEAKNFPGRNRIIAGLALGVMVVEAGKRSGALITARLASEYNREVFALPGNVDRPEQNAGCNRLIRDGGAKLVTCLEDVLDELGEVGEIMGREAVKPRSAQKADVKASSRAQSSLSTRERAVFDAVSAGTEDVDAICDSTTLDAACVAATLTALQLRGLVRQLPGHRFVPRATASV